MDRKITHFTMFRSYYDAYQAFENEDDGFMYLNALLAYAFDGKLPKIKGGPRAALCNAIPNIDASFKRQEAGRKNGAKGGAPKGNQNAKKKQAKSSWEEVSSESTQNKMSKEKEEEDENGKGSGG